MLQACLTGDFHSANKNFQLVFSSKHQSLIFSVLSSTSYGSELLKQPTISLGKLKTQVIGDSITCKIALK
jgi:hypothetical protein